MQYKEHFRYGAAEGVTVPYAFSFSAHSYFPTCILQVDIHFAIGRLKLQLIRMLHGQSAYASPLVLFRVDLLMAWQIVRAVITLPVWWSKPKECSEDEEV